MNYNYEPVCHSCSSQNVAQQQSLINHHSNICVTASYFSQVYARPRHFLIETQDETAADGEGTSLNQNGSKREVASLKSQEQECLECVRSKCGRSERRKECPCGVCVVKLSL